MDNGKTSSIYTSTDNMDKKLDSQTGQSLSESIEAVKVSDDHKQRKEKAHSNWTKIFQPWKWKRKKKSDKFSSTATTLERKISVRSTREDLIKRGLLHSDTTVKTLPEDDEESVSTDTDKPNNNSLPVSSQANSEHTSSSFVPTPQFSSSESDCVPLGSIIASRPGITTARPIHPKCSSDEVPRSRNEEARSYHRLSYQIATSYDNDGLDANSMNVGHFQLRNHDGNDMVAVGLIGKNSNQARCAPIMSGSSMNRPQAVQRQQNSSTFSMNRIPGESSSSRHVNISQSGKPIHHDNLTGPQIPAASLHTALGARFSGNHNKAASGKPENIHSAVVRDRRPSAGVNAAQHVDVNYNSTAATAQSDASYSSEVAQLPAMSNTRVALMPSSSNDISSYNKTRHEEHSQEDIVKRPVAAKRTYKPPPTITPQTGQISIGPRGPPPKPPPKPTKLLSNQDVNFTSGPRPPYPDTHQSQYQPHASNKPNRMSSGSQATHAISKSSPVVFAGSAEIIQRTTQIIVPQYISETIGSDKENRNFATNYDSDSSDSSGPILYKDDENSNDDDEDVGGLAAKVARRDTLALRLANRPNREELEQRNIISSPEKSEEERSALKINLTRRLSQRPTKSELQERNILPNETAEDRFKEREKVKRQLTRKLSMRPTVKELVERKVLINWHEYVEVYEVQNYDRRGDKPWTRLTPSDKASIRKELNEFKANEMQVHEESRRYTRFHKP